MSDSLSDRDTLTLKFPPGGISVTVTIIPKFYNMNSKGFSWAATDSSIDLSMDVLKL